MNLQVTRTRRQLIASSFGVVGAGLFGATNVAGLGNPTRLVELGALLSNRTSVSAPAVRLALDGTLTFPVDLTGGDLVMPNGFGGVSGVNGSGGHNGVDIGNGCSDGRGRPLLACVDGVLDSEKHLDSAGRLRVLRDGIGNYYRYHHMESFEPAVQVGDEVTRGQVIGYMGSSGNTSWAHLHFEVWVGGISPQQGGAPVDPLPRLPLPNDNVVVGPPNC